MSFSFTFYAAVDVAAYTCLAKHQYFKCYSFTVLYSVIVIEMNLNCRYIVFGLPHPHSHMRAIASMRCLYTHDTYIYIYITLYIYINVRFVLLAHPAVNNGVVTTGGPGATGAQRRQGGGVQPHGQPKHAQPQSKQRSVEGGNFMKLHHLNPLFRKFRVKCFGNSIVVFFFFDHVRFFWL